MPRKRIPLGEMFAGADGIGCPRCGCRASKVTHTYRADGRIERRRVCLNCGRPVATVEQVKPPAVIDKPDE